MPGTRSVTTPGTAMHIAAMLHSWGARGAARRGAVQCCGLNAPTPPAETNKAETPTPDAWTI